MELNAEDSDDIPDVTDDRGREDKSGEPTRIRDIFVHPIHSTRQTTVAEKTSLENPRGSEASTRIPSKSTSSARWTTVLGGREDESEESTRIRGFYPDPIQIHFFGASDDRAWRQRRRIRRIHEDKRLLPGSRPIHFFDYELAVIVSDQFNLPFSVFFYLASSEYSSPTNDD